MRQTYSFVYKGEHLGRLLELCRVSRRLHNQAVYAFRQELVNHDKWLFYRDLERLMRVTPNLEGLVNFKLLKAQCAQQCLREVDANIRAYAKAIKDWSKNKDKYSGKPQLPGYCRNDGRAVVFTNQTSAIKSGYIRLYKDLLIPIPQWNKYSTRLVGFHQIRVVPKDDCVVMEIVYSVSVPDIVYNGRYASMDLGVNNLVAMVTTDGDAVLYNGKGLKAINQWFNKRIAEVKSELKTVNGKENSRELRRLYSKRGRKIKDILHKVSRSIVNRLQGNNIGTLVVGYNSGWKQEVHLGTRNNQTFVQIPFHTFVNMLRYKCQLSGIDFVTTEEGYTSKCDALALESIEKHEEYLGKRVKRGLFQSSVGKLLNADVNGALNILRKVCGDSPIGGIADRGLLFNPTKCGVRASRFANKIQYLV